MLKIKILIIVLLIFLTTSLSGCVKNINDGHDAPPDLPPRGLGTLTVKEEYIVRINAWKAVDEYIVYIPVVINSDGTTAQVMNHLKLDSAFFYDYWEFNIINTDKGAALKVEAGLMENEGGEIILSAQIQNIFSNTNKTDVLVNLTYEPFNSYFINNTALSLYANISLLDISYENLSDRNLSIKNAELYYYMDTTPDIPNDPFTEIYVWNLVRYRRTFTWKPYYPDEESEGTIKVEYYGKGNLMERKEGWSMFDLTLTQTVQI